MSRIAKLPIEIPLNVNVQLTGQRISISGPKGELSYQAHASIRIIYQDGNLRCEACTEKKNSIAQAGTMRSLLKNMVTGVTVGFERRLQLVGVGYRAHTQENKLILGLGYSYPLQYVIPHNITIETPTQTEVVVKGTDKQHVGQTAAEIRSLRVPEPYKGKGIRYQDEIVVRKDVKKK